MSEDTDDVQGERERADRVCGWNGSRTIWRRAPLVSDPCPPHIRDNLARLRNEAEARAAEQRKRGLCV